MPCGVQSAKVEPVTDPSSHSPGGEARERARAALRAALTAAAERARAQGVPPEALRQYAERRIAALRAMLPTDAPAGPDQPTGPDEPARSAEPSGSDEPSGSGDRPGEDRLDHVDEAG